MKFNAPISAGKKTAMECGVKLNENFDTRFPYKILEDDGVRSSGPLTWKQKVQRTEEEIKQSWNINK
jgi:hypothetical protein